MDTVIPYNDGHDFEAQRSSDGATNLEASLTSETGVNTTLDFDIITRQLLTIDTTKREAVVAATGLTPEQLLWIGRVAIDEKVAHNKADERADMLQRRLELDKKTGAFTEEAKYQIFAEIGIEAVESGRPMQVLFCDLKRLKLVNDNISHDVGDTYLKNTVKAFSNFFGSNAKIIRWNAKRGDEFIIVRTMPSLLHIPSAVAETNHLGTMISLTNYVEQNLLSSDDFLSENQLQLVKSLDPDAIGISVGGVYLMPEDVKQIGQDVNNNERTLDSVIKRLSDIADKIMINGRAAGLGEDSLQFEHSDLFARTSKFQKAS